MSYTYYVAYALIPPAVPITFSDVADALRETFASHSPVPKVTVTDKLITLYFDKGWRFFLHLETESHVLEESREMAQGHSINVELAQQIAVCERRVTTHADDDPNMDYFNDYVFVLETLESFDGLILFDPFAGSLI